MEGTNLLALPADEKKLIKMEKNKYPKGHWMGIGIGIGMVLGMAFGVLVGVLIGKIPLGITLGPAMGVACGTAIGAGLEAKHKDNVREMTPMENSRRRKIIMLTVMGLIMLVILSLMLFLKKRAETGM